MTDLQWAVFTTLHQEPDYVFLGDEKKVARRMASKGWLRELKGNKFKTTVAGEKALHKFLKA